VRDEDRVRHEPRFLAVDPARNYTTIPQRSVHGEGECVSEFEQRALTDDAHRRDRARKVAAFVEARSTINSALDTFLTAIGATTERDAQDRVRTVRRAADALGRQL
jgi:hypothetical protein